MGVSILRNRLNPYNSLYFNKLQVFRSIGDMLIGSKIPPQADIIKFVIAGGYDFSTCRTQYVNLMFFCLHVTFPMAAEYMAS